MHSGWSGGQKKPCGGYRIVSREKKNIVKPNQISPMLKNEMVGKWRINRWYAWLEYLQDLPGFLSPRTKSSSDHCQVKNLFPKMPTLLQWWQSEINKIKFKKLLSLWIKLGHTTRVGLFYSRNPHFHYTGLLIIRAVADRQNSGISAKSREIPKKTRNTAKSARNISKCMSAKYI